MISFEATKQRRKEEKITKNIIRKKSWLSGGISHKISIQITYSINHIESSHYIYNLTRYIYETNLTYLAYYYILIFIKENFNSVF